MIFLLKNGYIFFYLCRDEKEVRMELKRKWIILTLLKYNGNILLKDTKPRPE